MILNYFIFGWILFFYLGYIMRVKNVEFLLLKIFNIIGNGCLSGINIFGK